MNTAMLREVDQLIDAEATRPLRVIVGAETFFPDINGAATFTRQLARGLAEMGHEVHVVAPSPDCRQRTEQLDNFKVHYVRSVKVPFHASMHFRPPGCDPAAMRRIVAQIKPDIVHIQSALCTMPPLERAAARAGIPVIGTNHVIPENLVHYRDIPATAKDLFSKSVWRQLLRTYGRCDVVTAPTQRAVDNLSEHGLAQPAYPISCGINLSIAMGEQDEPRPTNRVPNILFIGRLDPEKRICDLIEALARVPAEVPLRTTVIGIGHERASLERLATQRGVSGRVQFLGFVSDEDLRLAYRDADIFCMPSIAELQSIVTLEAVAARLPVVAANALALPHLVHDGVNGYLVEAGDAEAYARRLVQLAGDPELRERMGQAGRKIARSHDQSTTLRLFESIYRHVIARRAIPGSCAHGLEDGVFERLAAAAAEQPVGAIHG